MSLLYHKPLCYKATSAQAQRMSSNVKNCSCTHPQTSLTLASPLSPRLLESSYTVCGIWQTVSGSGRLMVIQKCGPVALVRTECWDAPCVAGGEWPHGCGQDSRSDGDKLESSPNGKNRSPDHSQPQHQWVNISKHTHTHLTVPLF